MIIQKCSSLFKIHTSIAALFLFSLLSCSHTHHMRVDQNIDPSFSEIIKQKSKQQQAFLIAKEDSFVAHKYNAVSIDLQKDSTFFTDAETGLQKSFPTSNIRKIIFTSHSTGFINGLKWGSITGASISLSYIIIRGKSSRWDAIGIVFNTVVFGLIGGILGTVEGDKDIYMINQRMSSK